MHASQAAAKQAAGQPPRKATGEPCASRGRQGPRLQEFFGTGWKETIRRVVWQTDSQTSWFVEAVAACPPCPATSVQFLD